MTSLEMASHNTDWIPGALVRLGSLEFIVTGRGGPSRVEAPALPPPNHTLAVSASAEFVGMAEYDSDSDAGSRHPSRECMMAEVGEANSHDGDDVANEPNPPAAAAAPPAR